MKMKNHGVLSDLSWTDDGGKTTFCLHYLGT